MQNYPKYDAMGDQIYASPADMDGREQQQPQAEWRMRRPLRLGSQLYPSHPGATEQPALTSVTVAVAAVMKYDEEEEEDQEDSKMQASTAVAAVEPNTLSVAPSVIPREAYDGMEQDLRYLRDRAKLQIQEAVNLLPMEVKQAYLHALEEVPHICETESDPLKYLRCCDYNVWATAERICYYWRERQDIFGPRAHLPMVQTGDGALTEQNTLSLRAGWPAILPNTLRGMQVVYTDRRQSHPHCTGADRLRCIFYVAHIIAQNERAQTDGVLVITLVTPRTLQDPRAVDNGKRMINLIRNAFPNKVHRFLVLNSRVGRNSSRWLFTMQDIMSTMISLHLEIVASTPEDVDVITEREPGEMLAQLREYGLQPEGLPTTIGGTWTFTRFTSWCRKQAHKERREQGMIVPPPAVPPVAAAANPDQATSVAAAATGPTLDPEQQTAPDEKAKQRERNLIHSRRKRERRKAEFAYIVAERDQLVQENIALLAESWRLRALLAQAQRILAENGL